MAKFAAIKRFIHLMAATDEIRFTKMHGIGNDYIYINCLDRCPERLPLLAKAMSDRHCGVGGDGIVLILPSEVADFKMRIFNADGSEARMCGNGIRCVAKYVYDNGLTDKQTVKIDTLSGVKTLTLHLGDDGKVAEVTVDMGAPEFEAVCVPVRSAEARMIDSPVATSVDGDLHLTAVSMGNPHGVVFVDNIADIHFETTGPELEIHAMWPDRANIEFAKVLAPDAIQVRVWERGSGETMACGTGACATAAAAILQGLTDRKVTIRLKGGDLKIEWRAADGHIYMRGPATTVFEGTYPIPATL